jgi:hypothetical protein
VDAQAGAPLPITTREGLHLSAVRLRDGRLDVIASRATILARRDRRVIDRLVIELPSAAAP